MPLPWRSGLESRIIEQLVWQWFLEVGGIYKGKAASSSGFAGIRGADRRTPYKERPWAKYRVARFLGVSHTWVNKLVKRFEADPERMRRKMAAFAPTSFEKLERAREETRWQRERGWLRGPIRVRRVKVTLWGKKRAVAVLTRAEKRRRALLRQGYGGQARLRDESSAARQARPVHVRYQELPMWARGLLLPGEAGMAPRRAVPFAFRRRR
ncbi:MAG TPA: hypothetical protein VGT03_15570 [Candidatus Acidoferrales bacterium]|nr:hypothetical protein [Candidatus Acidoferrales bacterium]